MMSQFIRLRSLRAGQLRAPALLSSVSLAALLGCSGDVVNLGEDASPRPTPPSYSRCVDSPTLAGDVVVDNQAQLDALEGCETIEGDVTVQPFFFPDLRPLHALKTVGGTLAFTGGFKDEQTNEEHELVLSVTSNWLGSFEGLEALQRAGSLMIWGTTAPDLAPLSGLRGLTGEGLLSLDGRNLRDLEPLARLQGIKKLVVGGSQLESIAALQLPPTLSELYIDTQQLADLGALSELRRVDGDLYLRGTLLHDLTVFSQLESIGGAFSVFSNPVLESLNGLESLTSAEQVALLGNAMLQSLDGLTSLEVTDSLAISDNERLRTIPDFPVLIRLMLLSITNNPALEQISQFSGILTDRVAVFPDGTSRRVPFDAQNELYFRADAIRIISNPALRSFATPDGWEGGKYVVIQDNASLETLELAELEAIDRLEIFYNPSLRRVDLGALGTVDTLRVLENPLLSPSTFDGVQTFEREMSGNSGQPPTPSEDLP